MEKTGAERVKYSLACQHEDAISIKFVSYAQKCPTVLCTFAVALRKESVDRNDVLAVSDALQLVALRKESVDRNIHTQHLSVCIIQSLSARRAWIEMGSRIYDMSDAWQSLSARRAWIEMYYGDDLTFADGVALRKESVDRNAWLASRAGSYSQSLSARRAWIEIVIAFHGDLL